MLPDDVLGDRSIAYDFLRLRQNQHVLAAADATETDVQLTMAEWIGAEVESAALERETLQKQCVITISFITFTVFRSGSTKLVAQGREVDGGNGTHGELRSKAGLALG